MTTKIFANDTCTISEYSAKDYIIICMNYLIVILLTGFYAPAPPPRPPRPTITCKYHFLIKPNDTYYMCLTIKGKIQTFTVDPNAKVFLGKKEMPIWNITSFFDPQTANDTIKVKIKNNIVIWAEVTLK